jgi:hypothetical protein
MEGGHEPPPVPTTPTPQSPEDLGLHPAGLPDFVFKKHEFAQLAAAVLECMRVCLAAEGLGETRSGSVSVPPSFEAAVPYVSVAV